MEVVGENGEIISDKNAVLDKWKNSFSELLQQQNDLSGPENRNTEQSTRIPEFEDEISCFRGA